jgi:hypothetical protein
VERIAPLPWLVIAASSVLAVPSALAAPATLAETRRVAVVVAHHDGGVGRAILQHAGADARAFKDVLVEVGGVAERDVRLIIDQDRHAFEEALAAVADDAVSSRRQGAPRVEVVVYYSGHSDEDGLLFGRERLPWEALRAQVGAIDADVKLVVLDSCASGAAVRQKGGRRRAPLLLDPRTAPRGHVWLTSSSADEASQESDTIGGSYFTHALVTALRGAADLSGDGRVTLDEAYRFAFQETLQRTAATTGGAQHANFDIQLQGAGELVLTDLREHGGILSIDTDVAGRVFVRDAERRLVAEVTKLKGFALPLALPPGGYDVVVVEGASASRARARVTSQGAVVAREALSPVDIEEAVPRGLLPLTHFPINLGFVSPLEINSYAPRVENNVGISLLFARVARLTGASLALGGNFVDERMMGAVFGVGFNGVTGPATGALLGGTNIALSDVDGAMGGIFFNLGTARTTGAAWALANIHNRFTGAQIGLVNVADTMTGVQLGLVNIANVAVGSQIGVVNIANSSTAPLGVASFVKDGQASVGVFGSDLSLLGLEGRAGGRHVWTWLRAGASPLLRPDATWLPVVQGGLGVTIPAGDTIAGPAFVDVDAGVGGVALSPMGSVGLRLRFSPAPLLDVSIGPELRLVDPAVVRASPWATDVGGAALWPGVVVGVSL